MSDEATRELFPPASPAVVSPPPRRARRRRRIVSEIHFSQLKKLALSPAHFKHALETPHEQTPAMRFGSLVHALVLGGKYVVYDGERRGNAWQEFQASTLCKLIVTAKELERAKPVANAVKRDPVAAPLLAGATERAWKTRMFGRMCAGRIDVAGAFFNVDLKTTNTAEPERFSRACLKLAYPAQLAWYRDARRRLGERVDESFIIGVETSPPFPVVVFKLTERALEEGAKLNRLWLERLQCCEESGEWPGYAQSVLPLDVPDDIEGLIIDGEEIEA